MMVAEAGADIWASSGQATIIAPEVDGAKLMAVPLFHITALCPIGLFSIPAGSKIVMMRKWDPEVG